MSFASLASERDQRVLAAVNAPYDPSEQHQILREFEKMLSAVIADGGRKRATKSKPHWTVDPSHQEKLYGHLEKYERGELVDPDSQTHPLVHVAARALMLAYQEINGTR